LIQTLTKRTPSWLQKADARKSNSNQQLELVTSTPPAKTKKTMPEKMAIMKFDPKARKHVEYKETKLK